MNILATALLFFIDYQYNEMLCIILSAQFYAGIANVGIEMDNR